MSTLSCNIVSPSNITEIKNLISRKIESWLWSRRIIIFWFMSNQYGAHSTLLRFTRQIRQFLWPIFVDMFLLSSSVMDMVCILCTMQRINKQKLAKNCLVGAFGLPTRRHCSGILLVETAKNNVLMKIFRFTKRNSITR